MLIREGMDVSISPTTVNREEHGHIIGVVRSVSMFAVTQDHMMATLQNQQLVHMFAERGAVLEVEVELLRSDETISGFRWSTPRGAPFAIEPGSIASGDITVYTRRPIDMVIPFIRRLVYGGDAR
jgi:HlyD family secretion protein